MCVVPDLKHDVFIGSDVLVRLGVQLDTFNHVLWSRADIGPNVLPGDASHMCSNQNIPQACEVVNKFEVVVSAQTAGFPVRLVVNKGQDLKRAILAFFQPSLQFRSLGLSVCGNSQLEVNNRSSYLLVQNLTRTDIHILPNTPFGYLIDSPFHDFELIIPVIGDLPDLPWQESSSEQVYFTHPNKMIAITPHPFWYEGTVCRVDRRSEDEMVVHAVVAQEPVISSNSEQESEPCIESYACFELEVQ